MATIEKRNGKYRVKVRRKGQTPATATFPNKKLAEHWAAQTELQVITGRYFGKAYTTTFGELVEHYQTRAQPLSHEESTIYTSQPIIKHWVVCFGALHLTNVKKSNILDARDDLVASGKKPSTVNRYMAVLSTVFSHGVERDWLEVNPCYRIKRLKDTANRGYVLTIVQEAVLRAYLTSETRYVALFALMTGARLSECLNLQAENVDRQRLTVTLKNTKNGEDRTIPVSSYIIDRIPLGGFAFNRVTWDKAVKEAGLTGFRFHDLRHTFITRAIERGVSPAKVAAYVGHKSLTMTAKYTHLDTRDLKDVAL